MRHMRVSDLLGYLRETVAETGSSDLVRLWLEEALVEIRSKPWAWNVARSATITRAVAEEPLLCTWVAGDTFVQAPGAVTLGYYMAGRKVKLGDEYYTVIDAGLTDATRYYVDRPISSSEPDGVALDFVRTSHFFKTSGIKNVAYANNPKLIRIDKDVEFHNTPWGIAYDTVEPGEPIYYMDSAGERMRPPAYEPVLVDTGAGTFTNGRYLYAFTRYDSESGLESPMGPMILATISTGFTQDVYYADALINSSEWSSHGLRLYRSEVDPIGGRVPMFLIGERGPDPSVINDANLGTMLNKPAYWDGPLSEVRLYPPPSELGSVRVEHVDNWAYQLNDRDQIALGEGTEITELLRLFLSGVVSQSARDPKELRAAMIMFRQQLNYLLNKSVKPGDGDWSHSTHTYVNDMVNKNETNWIDRLRASWE